MIRVVAMMTVIVFPVILLPVFSAFPVILVFPVIAVITVFLVIPSIRGTAHAQFAEGLHFSAFHFCGRFTV